jgi:hypothetical protein
VFDGVDDMITTESDIIGTSACTIMGWIKPTGWGESVISRILTNGVTYLATNSTGVSPNNSIVFTSDGGTTVARSALNSIQVATPIWYHIGVTRTSAGVANFYINSVLSGTANQASDADGTLGAGSTNVIIGNQLAGDRTFAGTIDDLQIYNRVLSVAEIQNHYLQTRGEH